MILINRSAVIWGSSIPLLMFIVWDAVILGSLPGLTQGEDPLLQLRIGNGVIGVSFIYKFWFICMWHLVIYQPHLSVTFQ